MVILTDYHGKRNIMLISIKTGHRYQASHRRFIYGFKTFLTIYTLGNSNFSRKMVNSNEKSQTLYFSNKNIESTYNLTVVMPPVFEVSTFKLILKCIFANNFLWHLHNTRFYFVNEYPTKQCSYSLPYVSTVLYNVVHSLYNEVICICKVFVVFVVFAVLHLIFLNKKR